MASQQLEIEAKNPSNDACIPLKNVVAIILIAYNIIGGVWITTKSVWALWKLWKLQGIKLAPEQKSVWRSSWSIYNFGNF